MTPAIGSWLRRSTGAATLAALALLAPARPAGAQDVRYEKYKLANGMAVILHEDHSLPVATINTWFRVGSKDEPPQRSGFAHLFEHLMFMGTERVPGNTFDTLMEAGGGANNASTSQDRTNYYSTGPASLLPTLLWLDADRLEDLARAMDQAKLDKQRDVVRNERRQGVENQPYGRAQLKIQDMMYPPGHPYHTTVIGSHQDLEAATVGDVKDFFATYYVPANATLVVAGDFDPSTVKPLIERLFGTIPARPEPPHGKAEPVRLDGVKRATTLDKVQLPMVSMVWHAPAAYAAGSAEMDLAGAVLADGKTSRLYKRLVYDDTIATSVSAYMDAGLLGSLFRVDVMTPAGADLDRVEKAVDEELQRLAATGPTAKELETRKATIELTMLRRLQSVDAVADALNEYDYFWGEPNSFRRDLDRYRNATPKAVQDWAARVLDPGARAIVRILPEAPERGATPRDQEPGRGEARRFSPPNPEIFELANGIPVQLWRKADLPLVAMVALFRTGATLDVPPRAGSVQLMAQMLGEGAGELGALEFGDAMQTLGAQFASGADHEKMTASLTVLKRNFPAAAKLATDAIRAPRFDAKEWDRVKRLHLEALKEQEDQPALVASRAAARAYFGAAHPYGSPVWGTTATVGRLSLDDIKGEWRNLVRPENLTLLVAGDLTAAEAKETLGRLLGAWKAGGAAPAKVQASPSVPKHEKLEVYFVDRPEAVQTVIHFLMPGPSYGDPARPLYELVGTVLGGSFTSRLNFNLRERHGYTYGAASRLAMAPRFGTLAASSSVKADATGESLKEFLSEFARLRTGDLSDEESSKAREQMRSDAVQSFADLSGILSEAAERLGAGVPFDTFGEDLARAARATTADLNGLASSFVPHDRGVLLLVGDRKTIAEKTKDLVPAPVELDVRGDPVRR